ncbi:MAG: MFS transporter [Bacteroidales bacterium]|nr:MFS transporter [Bacteroidales bacterium]MDD4670981.1 MFS transporter [Bacteroidales bacterium]
MEQQKTNIKVLVAAFLGIFFFGMAFLVMGAILPSLTEAFSLSKEQESTLASILPLGVLFGSMFFGPIIDRYGYKLLLIAATAIGVAGLEILAFSSLFSVIVIAVFMIGFCGGMLNGSTSAIVSDISSDKARTSNLFLLGMVYCIGAFTIPWIMATMSENFTYTPIVAVAGAVMFLSLLYYLIIPFPEAKCKQGVPFKSVLKMIKEPTLIIFSFALFFQSALEGISNNWAAKFLSSPQVGFSTETALYALSFILVGLAISRFVLVFVSRMASSRVIVITSMLLAAVGTVCLMIAETNTVAIVGTTLLGMGLAATFPVTFGILGAKYSSMSGTAFSFALVIALIGNTLLNKLVGVLGAESLPIVILCSIACLIVLFLIGCSTVKTPEKA